MASKSALTIEQKIDAAQRLFGGTITSNKASVGVEHFRAYPYTEDGLSRAGVTQRLATYSFSVLNGMKLRFLSADADLAPVKTNRNYAEIPEAFQTYQDRYTPEIGNMFRLDELVEHISITKDISNHQVSFYYSVAGQTAIHFADFLVDFVDLNNAKLKSL